MLLKKLFIYSFNIYFVIILSSCSLEIKKRLYRKGVYIDLGFNKKENHNKLFIKDTEKSIIAFNDTLPSKLISTKRQFEFKDSALSGVYFSNNKFRNDYNKQNKYKLKSITNSSKELISKSFVNDKKFGINKNKPIIIKNQFLRGVISFLIFVASVLLLIGIKVLLLNNISIPLELILLPAITISYFVKKKLLSNPNKEINDDIYKSDRKTILFFLILEIVMFLFFGLFWYYYLYYVKYYFSYGFVFTFFGLFISLFLIPVQSIFLSKMRNDFIKYKFSNQYKHLYRWCIICFILIYLNWMLFIFPLSAAKWVEFISLIF